MADVEASPEVGPEVVTDVQEAVTEEKEMTHEERKEEEQAVIQRQIEQTQAEMERLEAMEGDMEAAGADGQQGFNLQELEVSDSGCNMDGNHHGLHSFKCFNFLSMILL